MWCLHMIRNFCRLLIVFFYPIICLTKTLLVLLTLYTTTVDLKHKINLFRNYRHICLRSSDWLGHWIISYFLNPRNSWVAFLACFGSLSICTIWQLISLFLHIILFPSFPYKLVLISSVRRTLFPESCWLF